MKNNLSIGLAVVAIILAIIAIAKPAPSVKPPLGQITDISFFDQYHAGTTTQQTGIGEILADGSATTTFAALTNSATVGSCIELKDSTTTDTYRLYIASQGKANLRGGLMIEKGTCK